MSQEFHVKVTGTKQNLFKGESKKEKREDWHDGLALSMGSRVAADPNSGGPRGDREHDGIWITKERGAASAQLLQAHWKREILTEVLIEMPDQDKDGTQIVVERITLKNAWIAEFKRRSVNNAKDAVKTDMHHIEEYLLRYGHITVEDPVNSTSTTDDWTKPNG